jgi:hypothetical protein
MKIEHWLLVTAIIAQSITTLAAPIVAEFVKSRISRLKPAPEMSQPKNAFQRIEEFIRITWIYLLAIVINICVLLWELRQIPVPIQRDGVLAIAITMGSIYFCLALIFKSLIDQTVGTRGSNSIEQAKISLTISEIGGDPQKKLNDMLQASNVRERLDALKTAESPQGTQPVNPDDYKAIHHTEQGSGSS